MAVAAALPATASAAVTSQTIAATATPSKLPKKTTAPVNLRVETNTGYSAFTPAGTNPTPAATAADLDFDNDFVFVTKTTPRCNPASLAGTTTAAADAVCGASKVGSGSATLNGAAGPRSGVVSAYNATPVNGQPQILLHTRVDSLNVTTVLPGVLQTSPLGGDYGKRLHVIVPPIAGGYEVITQFITTIDKRFKVTKKVNGKKKKVRSGYVTAKCRDKNKTLNISSVFTFSTFPPLPAATSTQTATTSQKCKVKK